MAKLIPLPILPDGWVSLMPVRCMYCNTLQGYKDGGGNTAESSTICASCKPWVMDHYFKKVSHEP